MTAGIREWNGWMNGAGGLHAAIAQACRQSKNHRDRNAGEGTELTEESLSVRSDSKERDKLGGRQLHFLLLPLLLNLPSLG